MVDEFIESKKENDYDELKRLFGLIYQKTSNEEIIQTISDGIKLLSLNDISIKNSNNNGLIIEIFGKGEKREKNQNYYLYTNIDVKQMNNILYSIISIEYFSKMINDIPSNVSIKFAFCLPKMDTKIIKENKILFNLDYIYYIPSIEFDLGASNSSPDFVMININKLTINIQGKSGHSSEPFYCKNPISIGSMIIQEINSITSQFINPNMEKCIISFDSFCGGKSLNSIPDKSFIKISISTIDILTSVKIIDIIKKICRKYTEKDVNINLDLLGISSMIFELKQKQMFCKNNNLKAFTTPCKDSFNDEIIQIINKGKGMAVLLEKDWKKSIKNIITLIESKIKIIQL